MTIIQAKNHFYVKNENLGHKLLVCYSIQLQNE